ncbi:MAG: hypothetical protein KC519_19820 [Anaerolineae bacterium]|nr:hypothetical protein [Anaerolineae bacterium]
MLSSGYADFPPQELIRHFHGGKPGIKMGFRSEVAARRWLERERQTVAQTGDNAS